MSEKMQFISFIQSFSQSYNRTKDFDKNLSETLKKDLDSIWNLKVEEKIKNNEKFNKVEDFSCYKEIAKIAFEKLRINYEELELDLNSIYDDLSFEKLCFCISEELIEY